MSLTPNTDKGIGISSCPTGGIDKGAMKGTAMTDAVLATISDDVLIALRRLIRAVDLHSRYLSKHFGLTGPQLIILRELAQSGQMSPGEMAAAVSLSQATVTGITDRLEKRGLITKQKHTADRRKVIIRPTDACRQLLAQAPPPIQESFLNQFGKLKTWEQAMILSSLQRLVEMIDAEDIQAAPLLAAGPIDNSEG